MLPSERNISVGLEKLQGESADRNTLGRGKVCRTEKSEHDRRKDEKRRKKSEDSLRPVCTDPSSDGKGCRGELLLVWRSS